jgi:hypothetical protein
MGEIDAGIAALQVKVIFMTIFTVPMSLASPHS